MAIPNKFGDNDSKKPSDTPSRGALLEWVTSRVRHGREVRDSQYATRWEEYTRLWRGFWAPDDKNTNSERSRIITPALQQAVEMTAAEMEEATFGRTAWFDVTDDIQDEQKDDSIAYRDQLLEDFELDGVADAVSKTFLLGCLYGTGIAKINVAKVTEMVFTPDGPEKTSRISVTLEAIRPDEFVIDPSATSIDNALYCAHEIVKPLHSIKEKQKNGFYTKGTLAPWSGTKSGNPSGTGATSSVQPLDDGVLVTEYYGKVPAFMLPGSDPNEKGLVEALITIANESMVLKAVKSPFTMKDRPIIAYQHDTVPGQFWGRSVSEKGYNPQKANDAEVRARLDAMALTTAPMLGIDITRLPRNPDMRVRPGKQFFTRGRPSEIIEPVGFNAPGLAATFQNSSELERMVSVGTGAMDSALPIGQNRRNETNGGMSQMMSGFLKRSKRTMQNVERQFIDPLIKKSLWRYMQFDPSRYPQDMKFMVNGSMGLMAREVENQQLVQMLGFIPPESPAHGIVLKALFDGTNSADKPELKAAIDEMLKPPTEEQQQEAQQMKQLQLQMQVTQLEKEKAEIELLKAQTMLAIEKAKHEAIEADLEDDMIDIQAANAATAAQKARMADNQNVVAAQRNAIELEKVRKLPNKTSGKD